jgi:hypothetical protein
MQARFAMGGNPVQGWVDQHPALFAIIDVLSIYLVVSFTISWWSGWALLAAKFRTRKQFKGPRRWGQSGMMRWLCGYRNCLITGANSEGLYLATIPFFPLFHPPLFIPWTEIRIADGSFIVFNSVRLELGTEICLPLTISGTATDELRKAAGASWPVKSLG